MPNGLRKSVYFNSEQDKAEVVRRLLLEPWEAYCNANWLSEDDSTPFTSEDRVKRFLDDCAYILLRDNPEGTLSHYKVIDRGSHEIPASSCPAFIDELLYGGGCLHTDEEENEDERFTMMLEKLSAREVTLGKPKPVPKPRRGESRFERIERIRTVYPGCTFLFCRVDTDNRFEYNGVYYAIDESVQAYQPKQTKEGLLYDMDEIVAVRTTDKKLRFFDQQMNPLDEEAVRFA